jgi:hypothetical protein
MHRRLPLILFVLTAGLVSGVAVSSAAAPVLSALPTSVSFVGQKVGTTSPSTTVHVTNTGDADLLLSGVTASDTTTGAGFGVANNGCSGTIAPGTGCDITVSFAPTIPGPLTGVLSISSNDPASPTAVSLTGTGTVPQATVTTVPVPVIFATLRNVPQTLPVTLKNTGNAVLDVAQVSLTSPDGTFSNVGGTCGGALDPGASCSVQITFLPTTSLASNATVTFTDDDGSVLGSNQQVSLQGTVLLRGIKALPRHQRPSRDHPEQRDRRPHHLEPAPGRKGEELCVGKADLHRPGDRPRCCLQGQRTIRSDQAGRKVGHPRGRKRCRPRSERGPRRQRCGAGRRHEAAGRDQLHFRAAHLAAAHRDRVLPRGAGA